MTWDATAVVIVIGAFGTMLVTVIGAVFTGIMAFQSHKLTIANGHKSDAIITKTEQIHELTNSANAALVRELGIAKQEIRGLRELVAQMIESQRVAVAVKAATDLTAAQLAPAVRPFDAHTRADDPVPVEVVNQPIVVHTER